MAASRSRLSKKSVTVKIGSHFNGFLFSVFCFAKAEYPELYNPRKSLLRKNFDFLRNSRPNVPLYADGRELLFFRTFLQSVSVSKRVFRHAEKDKHPFLMLVLLYSVTSSRSVSAPLRLLFASQIEASGLLVVFGFQRGIFLSQ